MIDNVIIIGAPRSGTNMLRDMLTEIDGVETWPCDEINYIWRHGNISFPSDQLTAREARPNVIKYIQKQFSSFKKKSNAKVIVEKTCANSLRVDFVNKVIPNAKYIFIVRDGIDVVGSAKLRWTAPLDILYILKKVKYVPLTDLPFYAGRYFWHRLYKLFSKEKRLAYWGPTLPNMKEMCEQDTLLQICAKQWKACLNIAEKQLSEINSQQVYKISYENFVANPKDEFNKIAEFLGFYLDDPLLNRISSKVSNRSVGKGKKALMSNELNEFIDIISSDLDRLGYSKEL